MPKILLTPGEPAGVGPDITLQIAKHAWPIELIVIADPDLLRERAKQLQLSVDIIEHPDMNREAPHVAGSLHVYPVALQTPVTAGQLNAKNAAYVLQTLEIAAQCCLAKTVDAIVTGPVHKGILNIAGIPFQGHTEFFAEKANVAKTVMLFVIDQLKVALATTHVPLKQVSDHVTITALKTILTILHDGLQHLFHISTPRIGVCGLNPHAGENGYLGREEIDVITPAIAQLREENYLLAGPLSADTIFTAAQSSRFDAILAMYHDQALPLIKYLGFDRAVNVTLGLPFVRTSVDHGTALDVAGSARANAGSLFAAIQLAIELTTRQHSHRQAIH